MNIIHRPYQGKSDDQPIRDFLSSSYAVTQHPYYSADPPNWERISATKSLLSKGPTIHLWTLHDHPQEKLIGLVMYNNRQNEFSYLVHPDFHAVETLLCAWAEVHFLATNATQNEDRILTCSVCEKNEAQKAILSQRGYDKGERTTVFRKRSLDEIDAVPVLQKGYTIQIVQSLSADMFLQRVTVENQVFDRKISGSFLRELQKTPLYRPALDLVITTPNGTMAGFCSIWLDAINNVGFIEPIGVAADQRKHGFAKAMLITGLQHLQKLGATAVYLGHSAANQAGTHLYESVGMHIFDQEFCWQKEF